MWGVYGAVELMAIEVFWPAKVPLSTVSVTHPLAVQRAYLRRSLARQVTVPEFLDPLIDDGIYELEVL